MSFASIKDRPGVSNLGCDTVPGPLLPYHNKKSKIQNRKIRILNGEKTGPWFPGYLFYGWFEIICKKWKRDL